MKEKRELKVTECRGTAFEIGCQWGEGCKENIIKYLDMNFTALKFFCQAEKEDILANAIKFLPKVKEYDPYLIEMLVGQAEGAGVSFEDVFAARCMFELGFYYNQIRSMCTSFAATGKATRDGKTILGQTIDWQPGTPLNLLKICHQDGPAQLALNIGGMEYVLSSNGFGMCANATFGRDYSFNIPLGCYLPRVMRQKNVDDAISLLRQTARGLGYYHLASAEGQLVGIESTNNDFEVLEPQTDMLVHSNHYLVDRFKPVDLAPVYIQDSFSRVERIKYLMNRHYGDLTPDLMMEILSDHENYPNSICHHVDESKQLQSVTLGSFIMLPEHQKMLIVYGNPCEYEYLEYAL